MIIAYHFKRWKIKSKTTNLLFNTIHMFVYMLGFNKIKNNINE